MGCLSERRDKLKGTTIKMFQDNFLYFLTKDIPSHGGKKEQHNSIIIVYHLCKIYSICKLFRPDIRPKKPNQSLELIFRNIRLSFDF